MLKWSHILRLSGKVFTATLLYVRFEQRVKFRAQFLLGLFFIRKDFRFLSFFCSVRLKSGFKAYQNESLKPKLAGKENLQIFRVSFMIKNNSVRVDLKEILTPEIFCNFQLAKGDYHKKFSTFPSHRDIFVVKKNVDVILK